MVHLPFFAFFMRMESKVHIFQSAILVYLRVLTWMSQEVRINGWKVPKSPHRKGSFFLSPPLRTYVFPNGMGCLDVLSGSELGSKVIGSVGYNFHPPQKNHYLKVGEITPIYYPQTTTGTPQIGWKKPKGSSELKHRATSADPIDPVLAPRWDLADPRIHIPCVARWKWCVKVAWGCGWVESLRHLRMTVWEWIYSM